MPRMTRKTARATKTKKPNGYTSALRDEQAEQTRQRILDGATRVLARGASALTIPSVAQEAGVAIPTVYRYFASKEALEDGVALNARQLLGVRGDTPPAVTDLESWLRWTATVWQRLAKLEPGVASVLLSSIGRELPHPKHAERRTVTAKAFVRELAGVEEDDRERFIDVATAIASTTGAVSFLRCGLTAEQTIDRYNWLIRTLYGALRKKARRAAHRAGTS